MKRINVVGSFHSLQARFPQVNNPEVLVFLFFVGETTGEGLKGKFGINLEDL
jgi:hypothetical protein